MEALTDNTTESKLVELGKKIYDDYKLVDTEQELTVILNKDDLDKILSVVFGINYHQVENIRTDGQSVKLTLEKKA